MSTDTLTIYLPQMLVLDIAFDCRYVYIFYICKWKLETWTGKGNFYKPSPYINPDSYIDADDCRFYLYICIEKMVK